jgi:hypothetical protein
MGLFLLADGTHAGFDKHRKGKGLIRNIIWLNGKISANLRAKVVWESLIPN